MTYTKLDVLADKGYVILEPTDPPPESEWRDLEYMHWKSGGDTRFAPIASAEGEMECHGFWEADKTDKGGVWTKNKDVCPTLVDWTEAPGADYGRVRVIELQPNTYEDAVQNLHKDDNNRLNPDGTGWVVRAWLQLSDDPDSFMVLREDKDDPATESRIHCPAGSQFVVDTERLWHAVCHTGDEPRTALIVSWESGPELDAWIQERLPASGP